MHNNMEDWFANQAMGYKQNVMEELPIRIGNKFTR
jgi:hypothetical protein